MVLNTKVAGRLAELPVDLGSVVQQGDVVAVLDLTDFQLRVEQAAHRPRAGARAARRAARRLDEHDRRPRRPRSCARRAPSWSRPRRQRDRMASLHRDGILSQGRARPVGGRLPVSPRRAYQEALEEVRNRQALVAERPRGAAARRAGAGRRDAARAVRRRGARAPPVDRRLPRASARRSRPSCACIRCACGSRCPSARPPACASDRRCECVVEGDAAPATRARRAPEPGHRREHPHAARSRPRCRTTTARCGRARSRRAEIVVEPERPPSSCPRRRSSRSPASTRCSA